MARHRLKPKAEASSPPQTPLTPSPTNQFKKDAKRLQKQVKSMDKLRIVIETLAARATLTERHRDHALGGNWEGWRDCHVEPDWLLIYRRVGDELLLGRTGSHSELFEYTELMTRGTIGMFTEDVAAMRDPSRRGVTIAELLVIIAILAVLMAFLPLVIQRGRGIACGTTCSRNIRQIGLGLIGYLT